MKKIRRLSLGAIFLFFAIHVGAEPPISDDMASPVASLQRSELEILPVNHDIAEILMTVPGVGPGTTPPDRLELRLRGALINVRGGNGSAELTVLSSSDGTIKYNAFGSLQGNIIFFDLDGNGADNSDPAIEQVSDGVDFTGIRNYFSEKDSCSWRFRAELKTDSSSFETQLNAVTDSQVSPFFTRWHGGQVVPYVALAEIGTYTVDSLIHYTNPLGRPVGFDVIIRDASGMEADLTYGGQTGSLFPIQINPYSALEMGFETPDAPMTYSIEIAPLGSRMDRDLNGLQVSTEYNTWIPYSGLPDGKKLIGSAGLAVPQPGLIQTIPVNDSGEFLSAFSMLNVTSETAIIELGLYQKDPVDVEKITELKKVRYSMKPWKIYTGFAWEFFYHEEWDKPFEGTIVSQSDSSVLVTPLTTYRGVQSSSIPGGIRKN